MTSEASGLSDSAVVKLSLALALATGRPALRGWGLANDVHDVSGLSVGVVVEQSWQRLHDNADAES